MWKPIRGALPSDVGFSPAAGSAAGSGLLWIVVNMVNLWCIRSQYLSMVAVKQFVWDDIQWDQITWEQQEDILKMTVQNPTSLMYPPSLTYRKAFLKYIVSQLEKSGADICDGLYQEYTNLMARSEDAEANLCYKTYVISKDCEVTLQESKQLISQGTTGLRTWQAALHLAEWVLENPHILENRHVLELGSGLGMTGMVICNKCRPASFLFSDCHQQVLQLLTANVVHNLEEKYCKQESELKAHDPKKETTAMQSAGTVKEITATAETSDLSAISSCKYQGRILNLDQDTCTFSNPQAARLWAGSHFSETDSTLLQPFAYDDDGILHWQSKAHPGICILKLDWDKVDHLKDALHPIDVVLAADVVYDGSVIPALVRMLQLFLNVSGSNSQPVAYIASTIRNEHTRDLFLQKLDEACLCYTEMMSPSTSIFFYEKTSTIQILQIKQL